jgi:hypothetical protein
MTYIPMVQVAVVDLIRERQQELGLPMMPPLSMLPEGLILESQKGEKIDQSGGTIISVLLTNDQWSPSAGPLGFSNRLARYDGVIRCLPDWLLLVENKPRVQQVWEEQLHPSRHSFDSTDDFTIQPVPVVIAWSDILGRLAALVSAAGPLVGRFESQMIDDFLELVDRHWSWLNPYSLLGMCKDSRYLLNKRCRTLLAAVLPGASANKWGAGGSVELVDYSAQAACRFAFLVPRSEGDEGWDNWSVCLELYPGDTVLQARRFFAGVDPNSFWELLNSGWRISTNMHLAYRSSNLFWPKSAQGQDVRTYLTRWTSRSEWIRQVKRSGGLFAALWDALAEQGMIGPDDRSDLESRFDQTARDHVNVCPGFRLTYSWPKARAVPLDFSGNLSGEVREKLLQALHTWGQEYRCPPA